ncbi:hypothetical protein TELCIR_09211 [Teladorsagia circumcincta]|uniref:Uncharacterized protein n=1 Tax=Teladorsagia circumcincta TaxID=45464 RepID=A0A2G9UFH8_TELCI|nr:hypothetical protein TELCIR_09211 [Teladorsagia circumcincta]
MLRPSTWLLSAARLTSHDMRYVERVRLLDYWSIQDSALARLVNQMGDILASKSQSGYRSLSA